MTSLPTSAGRLLAILSLACCLGLTACGQKGDLYLPDHPPAETAQPDGAGA